MSRADPSSVRCVCVKLPLQVGHRDPVQVYFSSVLLQLQGSHDSGVKLLNSVRVDVISTGALLLHHLLIICGTDPLMEQRELTLCKTCSSNRVNVCYVQHKASVTVVILTRQQRAFLHLIGRAACCVSFGLLIGNWK